MSEGGELGGAPPPVIFAAVRADGQSLKVFEPLRQDADA